MRYIFCLYVLFSFTAQADSPFMTVKDRLRLELWSQGLVVKKIKPNKTDRRPQALPEEIERPLSKL